MASKKGKTLCITSAKGGVGKTTTTINMAGIFELLGKRVLIIDLDLYSGGIAISLNTPYERNIHTMIEDINNNRYREFSDYTVKYDDFIDVLPAPKDPRQASKLEAKYMELILDKASSFYDVVLVDTNHVLDEVNVFAMDRIDKILFIVTNDPVDLKSMRSVISIFKDIGMNKYKVLLNDSRDPFKSYFTLYDIKNILTTNVDYSLSKSMFMKDIDVYVMNGKIPTLDERFPSVYTRDYSTFMGMCADVLSEEGEE